MTRNEAAVVPRTRRTESLAARKEKANSGLFSFLRWFRKENKNDKCEERSSFSNPGSPVLRRSDNAITGSVDTLFSTATATSFAYIQPDSYRPFGDASEPKKWINPGPETNTYRNRIRRRDELRLLNQNLSLREKYNLYASGSLGRSLDEIFDDGSLSSLERLQPEESCLSTLARKKRKAPAPPPREDSLNSLGCDSLPTTLSKESLNDFKLHRRTVSESAKYRKKNCHVEGKRKAPPPPSSSTSQERNSVDLELSHLNTLKKKRKAPPPPIDCQQESVVNIPKEAALDIIENNKLKIANKNIDSLPSTSRITDQEIESISSTDTLRLERGMLRPNKTDKNYIEPKHAPTSPVSPRPWYKRPQSSGSSPKQSDWKKKESKSIEDWIFESGFPRISHGISNDSKFSLFNKSDKPEDKRRSQISILTNISELDREAAEIIQRGKEREKSLLDSYNAKYYVDDGLSEALDSHVKDEGSQTDAVAKKPTAKELISLFNSITNVSRVTVNNFIATEEMFSRNVTKEEKVGPDLKKESSPQKRPREIINGYHQKYGSENTSKDGQVPGPSGTSVNNRIKTNGARGSSSKTSSPEARISRVTIEELDEYDSEKSKSQMGITPTNNNLKTIPVITEVSDTEMKSSSGSTVCSSLLNDSSSSLSGESTTSPAKHQSSQFSSQYPLQKKLSMWKCSRCTLENPRWRLTCEACDMWRPTVCDYKQCKKALLSDMIIEQTTKSDLSQQTNSTKEISSGQKCEANTKILDKETTNLIRNGQVLANLSLQKRISEDKDQVIVKPISSQKPIEKEITKGNNSRNTNNYNALSSISNINSGVNSAPSEMSPEMEEVEVVRKARLAFFNKTEVKSDASNTDVISANNLDNISKATASEKLKLRELLKEMKNSLPKQRKPGNSSVFSNVTPSTSSHDQKEIKPIVVKQNSLNETSSSSNAELLYAVPKRKANIRQTSFDESTLKESLSKSDDGSIIHQNLKGNLHTNIILEQQKIDDKSPLKEVPEEKGAVKSSNKAINVNRVSKGFEGNKSNATETAVLIENQAKSNNFKVSVKPIKASCKPINNEKSTIPVFTEAIANISNDKKAEAVLIKSETIIEEIKIKKKPEKVSSSAQTSTKVLSLNDNAKSSFVKDEVIVPVTAEEYVLKDGFLIESSIRTEPTKVDVKKFELMRPRDFATKPTLDLGEDNAVGNDLQITLPSPSTPSSSSSLQNLNIRKEPQPGPSTSKDDGSVPIGTLALNRLLRRLESAITGGQHDVAAILAKELAKLKVPCSVVRQPSINSSSIDILMNVLIEDKTTQKGPIAMKVKPWLTLADLKRKMERENNIPFHHQRWFVDKKLASDDEASIKQLGIEGPSTPVYLYLIKPAEKLVNETDHSRESSKKKILNTIVNGNEVQRDETPPTSSDLCATLPSSQSLGWECGNCSAINKIENKLCHTCKTSKPAPGIVSGITVSSEAPQEKIAGITIKEDIKDPPREEPKPSTSSQAGEREKRENYQRLVDLEKDELVVSVVSFECPVCFIECKPPEGVVLKECLHSFCRTCLSKTIEYSEEAEVKCPFRDDTYTCDSILLEREIKALVSAEVYEEHLAKSIAQAETKIANAFHCKTPDCKGWCIYEDNVNLFKCPVCLRSNCLTCQAIHEGLNCKQYQEHLNQESEINIEAKRTKDMLQEMVDRGEAMPCPRCKVVLMKKWGCDWLRCSMCKTEICWVTRGPRWGPNGKGDTSGGCQCGVNGVKCHPKCNYCH